MRKITIKCAECPVIVEGETVTYEEPIEECKAFRLNGTEWTCPECGSPMYELAAA